MSTTTLGFADSGFVDAIRAVVIRVVVAHHNQEHQPLPLPQGVKLVQEKILSLHKNGDPLTGERWPYPLEPSMNELTIRKRFNEAAQVSFYQEKAELPPLKWERRRWMGRTESLYSPR